MYKISQAAPLPLRVSHCILVLFFVSVFTSIAFTSTAFAGAGHDHGAEEAQNLPTVSATPRLVMESSQFELVGVLKGKNLHLYLDDYASNTPITDATIELELAGKTWQAIAAEDGSFHIALDAELEEGVHSFLATILTKKASDLLTGDLDIHHNDAHETVVDSHSGFAFMHQPIHGSWLIAGALLLVLLFGSALLRDRLKRGKQHED